MYWCLICVPGGQGWKFKCETFIQEFKALIQFNLKNAIKLCILVLEKNYKSSPSKLCRFQIHFSKTVYNFPKFTADSFSFKYLIKNFAPKNCNHFWRAFTLQFAQNIYTTISQKLGKMYRNLRWMYEIHKICEICEICKIHKIRGILGIATEFRIFHYKFLYYQN